MIHTSMSVACARTVISGVIGFAAALTVQHSLAARQAERPHAQEAGAQAPPVAAPPQPARRMQFTEPSPLDFNDHEGYVSIFDGRTLDGWDGNPKFWRVEDGAIVGESTPERPSGNSYIAYRRMEAKDFTLKFEIKVEGTGGSGLQYRSRTGLPWLANIPANVTAFNGPVNLDWMMTGPQADFWPSRVYTGQFYSENTPMRILAWRGQVVEGFGERSKRLMGTIGDRQALGDDREAERLEPVHRDRARRHVPAYRQRPADGRHDRRRPGLVEQLVGAVRDRDRGDNQGVGAQSLGEEAPLTQARRRADAVSPSSGRQAILRLPAPAFIADPAVELRLVGAGRHTRRFIAQYWKA